MTNMFLPLYIDPGTGSMLFSIFIGLAATLVFVGRAFLIKLKFIIHGGKAGAKDDKNIPFVIFSDHKRYWNVFEPVCDEFEKRKIPLVFYTASSDDPALSKKYEFVKTEFIGEGNKAFAKLNFLHADVLLSTTPGLDVYQWKRSKYVKWYVHVPHSIGDFAYYKMFGLDFYDAVVVNTRENTIREIEAKRKIPQKEIIEAGLLHLDAMKERIAAAGERVKNDKPVVLLAPSWGKNSILVKYGEKILTELASTGFEVVVRPHPQSLTADKSVLDALKQKFSGAENLSWNFDNDNFDILSRSDIMISDFSGVVFDYIFSFDKPVLYADVDYDTSTYDEAWLDDLPWRRRIANKVGIKIEEEDFPNLNSIIENALTSESLSEERKAAKKSMWLNEGNAAKIVVDYVVKKRDELEAGTENAKEGVA